MRESERDEANASRWLLLVCLLPSCSLLLLLRHHHSRSLSSTPANCIYSTPVCLHRDQMDVIEKEVMPGVFLIQTKKPATEQSSSSSTSTTATTPSTISNTRTNSNALFSAPRPDRELEIARLEHSIFHLHRSNREMADFCVHQAALDDELLASIHENRLVIKRQRTTLALLHRSLLRDFGVPLPPDMDSHDDEAQVDATLARLAALSAPPTAAAPSSTSSTPSDQAVVDAASSEGVFL